MTITSLNVAAWSRDLIPPLLRRPRLLAFVAALLTPLIELNALVVAYVTTSRRQLSYNCQTLAFEGLLNDGFDPVLRRIRIANTDTDFQPDFYNLYREQQPAAFLFKRVESVGPTYLRRRAEFDALVGFVVLVPTALVPSDAVAATRWRTRLEATIRRYKYATIRHATRYVVAPELVVIANPNL